MLLCIRFKPTCQTEGFSLLKNCKKGNSTFTIYYFDFCLLLYLILLVFFKAEKCIFVPICLIEFLDKFMIQKILFFSLILFSVSIKLLASDTNISTTQLKEWVDECSEYNKHHGTDSIYIEKIKTLKVFLDDYEENYHVDEAYLEALAFYAKSTANHNPKASVNTYFKIIQLSHENDFVKSEAISTHELGVIYNTYGMADDALKLFAQSSLLFQEIEDWGAYAYSLIDIGNIYFRLDNQEMARLYYQQAKDIFLNHYSKEKRAYDLAVCENNFGQIELSLGYYQKALQYCKSGLKYREDGNLEAYYTNSYYYISNIFLEMNELDSALIYSQKAIEINRKLNLDQELGLSYYLHAKLMLHIDSAQALQYFHQGLQIAKAIENVKGTEMIYSALSKFYFNKDIDSSIFYSLALYNSETKNNTQKYKKNIATRLSELYARKGDSLNQIKFLNVVIHLLSEKSPETVNRSEFQIEKQRLEKEIDLVTLDAQRKKIYSILGGVIIVVLIVIVFIIRQKRRKLKQFSDQLAVVNTELNEVIKHSDTVYAIIAHDLRGPLGSSNQLLELIIHEDLEPEENKRLLLKVSDSISTTYNLLESLLTWSNFKASNQIYTPDYHNFHQIIENQKMLFKEQTSKKGLEIINEIDQSANAFFDYNTASTISRNLISNAIKYSNANSKIVISSYVKSDNLIIEIQDYGVGMSPEIAKNIISNKTNISTKGTSNEAGTGLGLQISKEFVALNKGKIWVESQEGVGSTFSFSLPLKG
mgnify:CR=1 FL=1